MLPFAVVGGERYAPVVLLGLADDGLIGFDMGGLDVWSLSPSEVRAVVSTDPAAIFYGVDAHWARGMKAVANRRKGPAALGHMFPVLPEGILSGFPVAAAAIRKHRAEVPSLDTIRVSSIFAVSTVRTRIEQAELAYACFGKLYDAYDRTMPPAHKLKKCFQGLQNSKSAMFEGVARYASEIQLGIKMGYRDRELRNVLALDSELPDGLGLAKLSFTLALLGHDTICLDGRLLGTMFTPAQRARFERDTRKSGGRISTRALSAYEAAEDAFLDGNPHYDARDPIGRARAQWMAWEAVGGKAAAHETWLGMLR